MFRKLLRISLVSVIFLTTSASWAGAGTYHDELDNAQFKTPLMKAAKANNLKEVARLIKSGADVNAVTTAWCSALMYAMQAGNVDIIKAIINAGAKIKHKTESGSSAFVFLGSVPNKDTYEVAKLFLDAGADVDAYQNSTASDINPASPISIAASRGNIPLLNLLLEHGASSTPTGGADRSAISNAIWYGKAEAVRILLKHGANIDDAYQRDLWEGWKPVQYAWKEKHFETVYVVHRAKAGKSSLEADNLDFDSLLDLMYRDNKVRLKLERKSIKMVLTSFDESQLRLLRNVIFARHNYAFKSDDLQSQFTELFPEYNAKTKKIKLSAKEKENIAFIRDIEKSKK